MAAPRERTVVPRIGLQTVGAVIAAFLRAAEDGDVSDRSGERYTPAELRELRAALSHVDSELGSMDVEAVRGRDVRTLLDELRDEGLSRRREDAIVDALGSLYSYALERNLVAASPIVDRQTTRHEDPPGVPPAEAARGRPAEQSPQEAHPGSSELPTGRPTPTQAVLAVGTHAAAWTTWIVVVAFAVVVLVLVVELV